MKPILILFALMVFLWHVEAQPPIIRLFDAVQSTPISTGLSWLIYPNGHKHRLNPMEIVSTHP